MASAFNQSLGVVDVGPAIYLSLSLIAVFSAGCIRRGHVDHPNRLPTSLFPGLMSANIFVTQPHLAKSFCECICQYFPVLGGYSFYSSGTESNTRTTYATTIRVRRLGGIIASV
jgi:hypothetical protein